MHRWRGTLHCRCCGCCGRWFLRCAGAVAIVARYWLNAFDCGCCCDCGCGIGCWILLAVKLFRIANNWQALRLTDWQNASRSDVQRFAQLTDAATELTDGFRLQVYHRQLPLQQRFCATLCTRAFARVPHQLQFPPKSAKCSACHLIVYCWCVVSLPKDLCSLLRTDHFG